MTEDERRALLGDYSVLADALEMMPEESISGAAFRVLRLNIADQITLDVARLVITASGMPADKQWNVLRKAAAKLRVARAARDSHHDPNRDPKV